MPTFQRNFSFGLILVLDRPILRSQCALFQEASSPPRGEREGLSAMSYYKGLPQPAKPSPLRGLPVMGLHLSLGETEAQRRKLSCPGFHGTLTYSQLRSEPSWKNRLVISSLLFKVWSSNCWLQFPQR